MADINISAPLLRATTVRIIITDLTITTNNIDITAPLMNISATKIETPTVYGNSCIIESPIFVANAKIEIPFLEVSNSEYTEISSLADKVTTASTDSIEITFTATQPNKTDYGIVWATHTNPTLDDNSVSYGVPTSDSLIVSCTVSSPVEGEVYYARSYIISDGTTIYSTNNFIFGSCLEVWTAEDLNNVRYNLFGNYKQMADIDLNEYSNWEPIGYDLDPSFQGHYDGQNYNISNLAINDTDKSIVGLFAEFSSISATEVCDIKNINLVDVNIIAEAYAGALAGKSCAKVTNCHSSGSINVEASNTAGGLIAQQYENSYNYEGAVWADHLSDLVECSSDVDVTGGNGSLGGLVGTLQNAFTDKCFATGDVVGSGNSAREGNFAGWIYPFTDDYGTVTNCYATGKVRGTLNGYAGGFAGNVGNLARLNNCYSVGLVTPNSATYYGGFAGINTGLITSCYYDLETSGQSDTDKGTPKTTTEMKTQSTFIDWDFTTIWNINGTTNNGYPFFGTGSIPTITVICTSMGFPYLMGSRGLISFKW